MPTTVELSPSHLTVTSPMLFKPRRRRWARPDIHDIIPDRQGNVFIYGNVRPLWQRKLMNARGGPRVLLTGAGTPADQAWLAETLRHELGLNTRRE